jgi:N6-adenosine-specific RNA methylase IME4
MSASSKSVPIQGVSQASQSRKSTPFAKPVQVGPGKPSALVYPFHRVTQLFPAMPDQELSELTQSICEHGLREPIKVVQGQVIDGRARLQACNDANVTPRFEELEIDEKEILRVVTDLNLRRRHLTESQRASVAANMASYKVGDNQHTAHAVSQAEAAKAMNVSVDSLQRAKKVQEHGVPALKAALAAGEVDVTNAAAVATLSPEAQTVVVAQGAKEIMAVAKQLNRERKEAKRQTDLRKMEELRKKNVPMSKSGKRYEVVLADPAWDYLGKHGTPYPTMTLEAIRALPIKDRAADNAVLFLWLPASLVPEAMQVIESWGFKFKTSAVWRKGESGLGGYFRVNHELLFVATRGDVPAVKQTFASCFEAPRGAHSEKPAIVFEMINGMYPELTKLELFCRGTPQAGWDGWGNECEGSIDMPSTSPLATAANDARIADIGDELMATVGVTSSKANDAPVKKAA